MPAVQTLVLDGAELEVVGVVWLEVLVVIGSVVLVNVVVDVVLVLVVEVVRVAVPVDVVVDNVSGGTKVVDGGAGLVGSEGVAKQVLTCRPAVSDARPSCCRGSGEPGGSVPT